MEYRPLDITVISAEGIRNVNMFMKMDVYVVVSVTGDYKIKKRTHVDKHGGINPRWSHRLKFTLPESIVAHQSLLFQIKSDRAFGDKDIGLVSVPIRELLESSTTVNSDSGVEQIVDYQVRTMSGKSKGALRFSYKFGEKFIQQLKTNNKKVDDAEPIVTAYPALFVYPPHEAEYACQHGPGGGYSPGPGYGGYHVASGYGFAPPAVGYMYPQVQHPGRRSVDSRIGGGKLGMGLYAYPPVHQPARQSVDSRIGGGGKLGLGLGAGLIGGLLVGEIISNVGEMAAYGIGYTAGLEDGMDFDM
ncbi:hypothetical protein LguiA_007849 [Lonicera macranthoides]